ncbi:MAG: hypothetical protein IJU37_06360 [Desulfovibrio sp.]|nr:hypothetical protein [Desulfovibrio sp.]
MFNPSKEKEEKLAKYFSMMRRVNRRLVRTDFLQSWNFRLAIAGAPTDFDFYVKDITYGILDVATDEARIGTAAYVWPSGKNALRVSFTVRDDRDRRIQTFFIQWSDCVFPKDGTVNTPYACTKAGQTGYLKAVALYEIDNYGDEVKHWTYHMYPTNVGEASRSRETGEFFEIPVTLTEFSSIM